MMKFMLQTCALALQSSLHNESGYEMWLRYRPVPAPQVKQYASLASTVSFECDVDDPITATIKSELKTALSTMLVV